uniref:RING-type domain-containing protein n=1 Tax=Eutreptiella gymnastica TaxID=73025 RepID=A0A7S1JFJ2_9EUGL|mmetsp:Transcript_93031/g.161243  ORF Transcript_93031/g.161243 Transcript_93031/m.161243 type:complete len:213 (+) Transcript_93031:17-655(+)
MTKRKPSPKAAKSDRRSWGCKAANVPPPSPTAQSTKAATSAKPGSKAKAAKMAKAAPAAASMPSMSKRSKKADTTEAPVKGAAAKTAAVKTQQKVSAKRTKCPHSETSSVAKRPKRSDAKTVDCIICYEKIPDRTAYPLACKHSAFHKDCILEWLQRSQRCPLCDAQYPEFKKAEPTAKPLEGVHSHLPLSVLLALPGLAQSLGVPYIFDPA